MPSVNDATPSQFIARKVLALTGQTTALGLTNVYANAPAGVFRLSWYMIVTTPGSAGTITVNLNWTDEAAAQTATSTTGTITSFVIAPGTIVFHTAPSTAITVSTAFNSVTGNPAYALYVQLEQLQ